MYTYCGTACPNVCNEEPAMICTIQCVLECQCPSGLYRVAGTSQCVAQDLCPARKSLFILWGFDSSCIVQHMLSKELLIQVKSYLSLKAWIKHLILAVYSIWKKITTNMWTIKLSADITSEHGIQPQNTDTYVIKRTFRYFFRESIS